MNRKLLALAVGAALALPLAAQAAPTIYGQLNLSVDMADVESQGIDAWAVNSNSSRLGVKGEEDLGGGLSAIYMAEWGVSGDGAGTDLDMRNRYLGVKGGFGTVKVGSFDSPLKTSQGMVDQFNDMTYTDIERYMPGENRLNNLIGYESPKIADAITVSVAIQPGETTGGDDGLADAISASVVYEAAGLNVALAMDKDVPDSLAVARLDIIRLSGSYTLDALQLGAMFQQAEASVGGGGKVKSFLVSGAYTMDKNVLKAQFVSTEDEADVIMLGGEHNFTQATKAYLHVAKASWDAGSTIAAVPDSDDTVVTIGMQTKF